MYSPDSAQRSAAAPGLVAEVIGDETLVYRGHELVAVYIGDEVEFERDGFTIAAGTWEWFADQVYA